MTLDDRLAALAQELAQIEVDLSDPAALADQRRYTVLTRRHRELGPVVEGWHRLEEARDDLGAARELAAESEGTERDQLRREAEATESLIAELTEQLRVALIPRDPNDDRDVIVEIRGAEGGEEANLFARDLFDMYRSWAERRGWRVEVMSLTSSPLGGVDHVVFQVAGDGAWRHLKHEAGPHRVQRVPVTESQGRVHTSSATVSVLPEADEVDVQLDPNDLDIDVYRSSGPGGQSVNTTDSAVRITHRPTGLVVAMQDEKSQLQNKAKALRVLRSRLLSAEQDRQAAEASATRRGQVGGGGRSEKVRTYNFKESRVSDHRIGLTVHQLDRVLGGDLDEISDALVADEQATRLAQAETAGG
jgi:peptide chain release factor 1